MEARHLRNNLLSSGIEDGEVCADPVLNIIHESNNLKINSVVINSAFRIGKNKTNVKNKPSK